MPYAAVNGLDMYYEVHGAGPPLLLLHGGSDPIPERWIPFFTPRFRVIAPEQMGHGRTADHVDRPFRYHEMAEDTVELMRQLGIASAAVVGYSDGGIIGLDMAIHHPARVTKVVATGANARFDGYTAKHQDDEERGRLNAPQFLVREARLGEPHRFQACQKNGPVLCAVGRETCVCLRCVSPSRIEDPQKLPATATSSLRSTPSPHALRDVTDRVVGRGSIARRRALRA